MGHRSTKGTRMQSKKGFAAWSKGSSLDRDNNEDDKAKVAKWKWRQGSNGVGIGGGKWAVAMANGLGGSKMIHTNLEGKQTMQFETEMSGLNTCELY
jgi:hypothetical protein